MLWLAGLFFLALRKIAQKFVSSSGGGGRSSGAGRSSGSGKSSGGGAGRFTWFLPFVCLVLAVSALVYAPLPFGLGSIGSILAGLLNHVFGWAGELIGVSATAIAGLLLVLTIVFGLVDLLKDRKPDGFAKTMVFAVPVLVLVASGPLAANVSDLVDQLSSVGPDVVAQLTS